MFETIDSNADYTVGGGRVVKGFDIIAFINALKDAFVVLQRPFRPEVRRAGGDEVKWRNLAFLLLANECSPHAYMHYAFDYFSTRGNVHPNMVTSPSMAEKYITERPSLKEQLELAIRLQADTVAFNLKRGRTLEEILGDFSLELSAVFRFALAWSEKRFELAERFRAPASKMIMFEPLYKKLLEKWLPEELRR